MKLLTASALRWFYIRQVLVHRGKLERAQHVQPTHRVLEFPRKAA